MKLIKYCFLFLFWSQACAQSNGYLNINGQISGLKDGVPVYLSVKKDTIACTLSADGKFTLRTTSRFQEGFYFIWIGDKSRAENIKQKRYLTLFLDKPSISVNGVINQWPIAKVVGSPSHSDYMAFQKMSVDLRKPLDSIQQKNSELSINLNDKFVSDVKQLVDNYPNAQYAAWIILRSKNVFNPIEKKLAYDKLSDNVKHSVIGIELKRHLETLDKSESVMKDNKAPDFVLQTPKGENVSLNDVIKRSKYTLIDFWASWCGPCRAETPAIKKLYDQFHGKGFNILSVSLDNDSDKWQEAILEDQMNWPQVLDPKGFDSEVALMYQVTAIPRMYLIDNQGNIIDNNIRSKTLGVKLNELFK